MPEINAKALERFLLYARRAGNHGNTPPLAALAADEDERRAARRAIRPLVTAGLVSLMVRADRHYVMFTEAGVTLAAQHGLEVKVAQPPC